MNIQKMLALTTFLALSGFGIVQAQTNQAGPATFAPSGTSSMLVDSGGMTLYTYDRDTGGKSSCYVTCADNWPPFVGNAASKPVGNFTVITRDDGSKQWAINGKPLYYWHNDKKPGDKTGDNIGRVWHIVTH